VAEVDDFGPTGLNNPAHYVDCRIVSIEQRRRSYNANFIKGLEKGHCVANYHMTAELLMLGGAEEIGANCTYLDIDGTGILVDAGLHPKHRDARAFPAIDYLQQRPTDALLITHAHTDHLAGLPYVMRRMPHLRPIMTHATRDLSDIMLQNSARLLKTDISAWFSKDDLDFYNRETIEMLRRAFEAAPYAEAFPIRGYNGGSDVMTTFHWAGHILGSASVEFQCKGLRILHTGDIQFDHQTVISKSRAPRGHVDVLICEATNCLRDQPNNIPADAKRLGSYINMVTSRNGSVLIPSFALGKTQEILTLLYSLMRKGSIPHLPIWTGGMGVRINKIYDQYCYTEPMRVPGFEVSDIPQHRLNFETLFNDAYMKTPSIVVAPSGMMNRGTLSFALATRWMEKPSYGIAFIGFQDEESPGHQLLHSLPNKPFEFAGRTVKRSCAVERFRFSAHASLQGIIDFITDVRPTTLAIMHGEPDACDMLAMCIRERLPATRIVIPRVGVPYIVGHNAPVNYESSRHDV